jgi:hypothetical protein
MALNNACRMFPAEQKVMEPEIFKLFHEAESKSYVNRADSSRLTTGRSPGYTSQRSDLLRPWPSQPLTNHIRRSGL